MGARVTERIVVHHVDDVTGTPTGLATVEKLDKRVKKMEHEVPSLHRELLAKERNILQKLT